MIKSMQSAGTPFWAISVKGAVQTLDSASLATTLVSEIPVELTRLANALKNVISARNARHC